MNLAELRILFKIYWTLKKLEAETMANFDAINAELEDLKASNDLVLAKIDELRAILDSDSADQEKLDAITATLDQIDEAQKAKVAEKNP